MVRYTGPKNRIARRFGANIFGYARNPLLHKSSPPGMHGAKRKKKSDHGIQLDEQQKLRAVYGMITRKQLIRYYHEALKTEGNTILTFLQLLESRLDNVVYRLKFAPTIFAAQQLVSHGHILVDGKKVDRRSFRVRPGMIVSVRQRSQQMLLIKQAVENPSRSIPEYLSGDSGKMEGSVVTLPDMEQVPLPLPINVPLVCEFLAHTG